MKRKKKIKSRKPFIKFNPKSTKLNLLLTKRPEALGLLVLIAKSAKREDDPILGLEKGEAIITDFKSYKSTPQSHKTNLAFLVKIKEITTRTIRLSTSYVTVQKLISKDIFDINVEVKNQPVSQPVGNQSTPKINESLTSEPTDEKTNEVISEENTNNMENNEVNNEEEIQINQSTNQSDNQSPNQELTNEAEKSISNQPVPQPETKNIKNIRKEIKKKNKKRKFSSLKNLTDDVVLEVADLLDVDFVYAKGKVDEIKDWCEENDIRKKNYKATLRKWIRGDIKKGIAKKKIKPQENPFDNYQLPSEENQKTLKSMEEFRRTSPIFIGKPVTNLPTQNAN